MTIFEQIDIENSYKNIDITDVFENILKTIGLVGTKNDIKLPFLEEIKNKNFDKTVIVLADGLGAKLLKNKQTYVPFLRKQNADIIKTCLPSTTVSAITAFTTGKYPSETQMLGWSIIEPKGKKTVEVTFLR